MSRQNNLNAGARIFSRYAMATLIAGLGIVPAASFINVRPAIAQNAPNASDAALFSSFGGDNSDAALAKFIPSNYRAFVSNGKFLRDQSDKVIISPVSVPASDLSQALGIGPGGNFGPVIIFMVKIDSSYTSYIGAAGTYNGSVFQKPQGTVVENQGMPCLAEFGNSAINNNCVDKPSSGSTATSGSALTPDPVFCAKPENLNSVLCSVPPALPTGF